MLSKSQNSRLRNTQRSEEDAHGYHHASHNCPCHSVAWRRRLVRPWTLVLDAADFKLARRCNAAASFFFPAVITCFGLGANFYKDAVYPLSMVDGDDIFSLQQWVAPDLP
jgi:hypothetical protein